MGRAFRFLADLWYLMRPYFVSEERVSAWALLVLLLMVNLAQVGLGLAISFSRNIYYTALQQKDAAGFFRGLFWFTPRPHELPMPGFFWFAAILVLLGALTPYIQSVLQIRWRRWMTNRLVAEWLSRDAHFRISLRTDRGSGTDNPDQRIQEDVDLVTDNSLTFTTQIVANAVTIVSYGGLLWALSGRTVLFGYIIPGFLFWLAFIYSGVVTFITHLTGRRLTPLTFAQQRLTGNFRFGLVRLRESSEAIALYRSEDEERRGLTRGFRSVYENALRIINRTAWLTTVTGSFSTVSDNLPLIIWSPRFFVGRITFGTLMQVVQLFQDLQGAFLWFMNNYAPLAGYAADIERLATFQRAIKAAQDEHVPPLATDGTAVETQGLEVYSPDRSALLAPTDLRIERGVSTAIVGPSGAGKSSLFRALAGIWPYASGSVRLGGTHMFLPQRPYLPTGTLARVLCYPLPTSSVSRERLDEVLGQVGLSELGVQLDEDGPWAQILSPGQQQRVAIGRALLVRPDWLFLDEATASLDGEAEQEMYALLAREMPGTTLVSITHSQAVARLHRRVLRLERNGAAVGQLVAA